MLKTDFKRKWIVHSKLKQEFEGLKILGDFIKYLAMSVLRLYRSNNFACKCKCKFIFFLAFEYDRKKMVYVSTCHSNNIMMHRVSFSRGSI